MKAKPLKFDGVSTYTKCTPDEATHVAICTPGPFYYRHLPVGPEGWEWNKDTKKPTLRPSILTHGGNKEERCHSYVTDGKIKFLPDCTHEFAGKTVDLLDVD